MRRLLEVVLYGLRLRIVTRWAILSAANEKQCQLVVSVFILPTAWLFASQSI